MKTSVLIALLILAAITLSRAETITCLEWGDGFMTCDTSSDPFEEMEREEWREETRQYRQEMRAIAEGRAYDAERRAYDNE